MENYEKNIYNMIQSIIYKSLITWALFIPIAIVNGVFRELLYTPFVGELAAHQISTAIAITTFISLVYFLRRKDFRNLNISSLLSIGAGWAVLTVIFEFGFGHYIDNASWGRLLQDYDISKGRVWILMLLTELFTPIIIKYVTQDRR